MVARQAHNLKAVGSNPAPATNWYCSLFPLHLKKNAKIKTKKKSETLFEKLILHPENFSFVKAIDISAKVCGIKFVEIKSNINFASKFNDISLVEGLKDGFAEIYTNLGGIAGIEGALPDCYLEDFIIFNRKSKKAIIDFFDIFNEKILLLQYDYLKKQNIESLSESIEKTFVGNIIFSLSGIDSEASKSILKSNIPEQFKVSAQNLLWRYTRSATGLEAILTSFFKLPIKIKQFSGDFIEIDKDEQTAIGSKKGRYNNIGENTILGNKIWDQSRGIDIIVGPLQFRDYIKFLPKLSHRDEVLSPLQKIKEIIRNYVPYGITARLYFYLDKCQVKETLLNSINRLNKDAFIFGKHLKNAYFTERV